MQCVLLPVKMKVTSKASYFRLDAFLSVVELGWFVATWQTGPVLRGLKTGPLKADLFTRKMLLHLLNCCKNNF